MSGTDCRLPLNEPQGKFTLMVTNRSTVLTGKRLALNVASTLAFKINMMYIKERFHELFLCTSSQWSTLLRVKWNSAI